MKRLESEKPLYKNIFDQLSRDILSGEYKSGQKFPSEAQLIKRFGVSRTTVGRALRDLQQAGLIERVAGSGTFVRDPARRPLENLLFGLIIPNLGDTEIFEPICQAIAASPDANGHGLLWGHADNRNLSKEEQALQLCRQYIARKVSGVFFAPVEFGSQVDKANLQVVNLLKKAQIPVVLLDRRSSSDETLVRERLDLVGLNNHLAGYIATQHLLRSGAKRIGFVGVQNQAITVKARIAGYQEALSHFKENADVERIYLLEPNVRLKLPVEAKGCDAFVCANDRVAGLLMHTLLAQKVRIPQDIKLIGIDDVNYASLLPIPLTTVRQPCRDIGEAALRAMLDRLQHPNAPARDILLDCHLVVRESCGYKT